MASVAGRTVRCKMRCVKVEISEGQEGGTVRLIPVAGTSEENKLFWKWTPSGTFEFTSINQEAFDQFKLGREVYVDLTQVSEIDTARAKLAYERQRFKEAEVQNFYGRKEEYERNIRAAEQAVAALEGR